jgi:hypothetical protein
MRTSRSYRGSNPARGLTSGSSALAIIWLARSWLRSRGNLWTALILRKLDGASEQLGARFRCPIRCRRAPKLQASLRRRPLPKSCCRRAMVVVTTMREPPRRSEPAGGVARTWAADAVRPAASRCGPATARTVGAVPAPVVVPGGDDCCHPGWPHPVQIITCILVRRTCILAADTTPS